MALDVSEPGSPGAMFMQLLKALAAKQDRINLLWKYYDGDHPLPHGADRATELYRNFQKKARSNYVGLVTDSVLERLEITGFRAGKDDSGAPGTPKNDAATWAVWQANSLDSDADLVHLNALVTGEGYVMVGPNADDTTSPLITSEDPGLVHCAWDPIRRRIALAAIRVYDDITTGCFCAQLYTPKGITTLQGPKSGDGSLTSWTERQQAGAWTVMPDGEQDNPYGVVPIVRFLNRPKRNGYFGKGEFEDVIDIQDRMNSTILDRMVISKLQAYRQRWATGVSLKDEDGNDVEPFIPGVDLLWHVEDDQAKFGDFAESDISKILAAINDDIKDLAAITRTPPHYLLGEIVNASGDALAAAETGLVAKAKKRQRDFGESWEQVMRLAAKVAGGDNTVAEDAEVVWKDPENHSIAELADAAVKKDTAGVPWRQNMVDLGYTDQQIDQMEVDRAADALLAPAPVVQPVLGGQPGASGAPGAPGAAPNPGQPAQGAQGQPGQRVPRGPAGR